MQRLTPSQQPSQSRRPWRATARTVFAGFVAIAPLAPTLAQSLGVEAVPVVAGALVLIGGVTRLLAEPNVEAFLRQHFSWLSAEPERTAKHRRSDVDSSELD